MTWFFPSTLIWYHTSKQIQHKQGPIKWHIYLCKYILTPPVLCSQQLSLWHSMNNQKLTLQTLQCLGCSKITDLWKSHISWLNSIRLISSNETQEFWKICCKHTKKAPTLTQRKIRLEEVIVVVKISDRVPSFFKITTLFHQTSVFMSKIWPPPFFFWRGEGGSWKLKPKPCFIKDDSSNYEHFC